MLSASRNPDIRKYFKLLLEGCRNPLQVGSILVRTKQGFSTFTLRERKAGRPFKSRFVRTLDPRRMAAVNQQLCDISGTTVAPIHIIQPENSQSDKIRSMVKYKERQEDYVHHLHRFPPSTKGLFYYHRSEPEISSSIRFRICNDPSPASFSAGTDLMLPATDYGETLPWNISLSAIASARMYGGFEQCLLQENLVDAELLNKIKGFNLGNQQRQPLYTFDQPFVCDLSSPLAWMTFLTAKHVVRDANFRFFTDINLRTKIYSGIVRVRFVMSHLPQHKKNPSILLQYLEIISPIKHVHPELVSVKRPVAGEYLERMYRGKFKPWSLSLKNTIYGRKIAEVFDLPV